MLLMCRNILEGSEGRLVCKAKNERIVTMWFKHQARIGDETVHLPEEI